MKPVYLNYIHRSRTSHRWLLLITGVLVMTAIAISYQQIKSQNTVLQDMLAKRMQASSAKPNRRIVPENPQIKKESEAIYGAIRNIVIPWASLWKSLEAAHDGEVHMLSLEPNAKTGSVRMNLIASNHAAMWTYLQNLNRQVILGNVRLVSSESADLKGLQAVAFSVEASWSI